MTNKKSESSVLFTIALYIILGLILGLSVGGFFAWKNKKEKERLERPLQAEKTQESKEQKNKRTKEQDVVKPIEVRDWQNYENKTYKYKIKYPKNWFVSKESEEMPWLVIFASYDLDKAEEDTIPAGVKVEILVQGNPRNLSLMDWAKEGHALSGEPKLSQEIKVSGFDAIREELEFEGPTANITFFRGQDVFTISYSGTADEYNQYLKAFEEMVESVEIE